MKNLHSKPSALQERYTSLPGYVPEVDWKLSFHDQAPDDAFIGWLLPDGSAIGTHYLSHGNAASAISLTQKDLEDLGWVKLTRGPAIPGSGTFFLATYTVAYAVKALTRLQEKWLDRVGFFEVPDDKHEALGIRRFAHRPEGV